MLASKQPLCTVIVSELLYEVQTDSCVIDVINYSSHAVGVAIAPSIKPLAPH